MRIAAASALGGFGPAAKDAVPALRAAEAADDFRLAGAAMRSLALISKE